MHIKYTLSIFPTGKFYIVITRNIIAIYQLCLSRVYRISSMKHVDTKKAIFTDCRQPTINLRVPYRIIRNLACR